MTHQPVIYIIAGPNGVGKTTAAYTLIPSVIPIINSDIIAKEAKDAGIIKTNAQEYANRESLKIVNDHIEARKDFAFETNLADNETWRFIKGIKGLGYKVELVFISLDDVDALNDRIRERVAEGGHFVRPDVVKSRYEAGLLLLKHYYNIPDVLTVIDNSNSLKLIATIHSGSLVYNAIELPQWVEQLFGKDFSVLLVPGTTDNKTDISNRIEVYKKNRDGGV